MKSIYKITLLLLLIPLLASANNGKKRHEKNKVIKKVFAVNADAKVVLNNKYGNLNITTWDKNSVEIEVTITIQGDDLDDVEDKLTTIGVAFNANSELVEARTIIENKKSTWSWWKKSNAINYKINYVVKMPKSNAVDLNNDYGNIYLDNLEGKAVISCDYGKISIGNLSSKDNDIRLNYATSSSIHYMKDGEVNIDYSKLNIENSESVRVVADYSNIKLEKALRVDFNCDYGSLSIDEVESVKGNSDYVSMHFGTVKKYLFIETDYGSLTVKNLAKGFENVDIDAEYAGVRIGVDPNAVFEFEIDLQYAGFSRSDENITFYKSISKATEKYYEGKFGKGKTNSKLKIKSQYGGVNIK
ncbi:hypothetical protein MPF19_14920 [Polaribacter sp. Z014]|uniref:hypothetical protein n=1 Tax=Polaribacter sp. Z014 TaxID=2927126 RepID=UPI0020225CF1|nr:hypothetical protein [Polaribacter sp. Z014]MCL7764714.1 hypothetical protein [Polaribacter sp. Z014]